MDLRPYVLCGKEIYVRARRADARGDAQGIAGGELVAGRRQQGHVGACASRWTLQVNDRTPDRCSAGSPTSVYWMGRYIERAENVARFLDVNHNLMLDLPRGYGDQWQPIVDTTGDRAIFQERYGVATQENVVRFLAFDAAIPELDLLLRAGRAGECALGAGDHLLGDVGADQQPVPADHQRGAQAGSGIAAGVLPPACAWRATCFTGSPTRP